MLLLLFTIGIASFGVYWMYNKWSVTKRLPPGPKGDFLLGNAPQLDENHPQEQLEKWRKEFGDVYRLNMAGIPVVVVSSEEAIKDVLITKDRDFSGRYEHFRVRAINNFHDFVGFADDTPHWRNMKKALMTSLKMYGDNLLVLEALALKSVKNFVQSVRSHDGHPFDPQPYIVRLTSEIIAQLIHADKFHDNFPQEILDYDIKTIPYFIATGPGRELDTFPWLRHFGNRHWKVIKEAADFDWNFNSKLISDRKKIFDLSNPKCLIDALYKQFTTDKAKYGKSRINETDIQMIVTEAIRAGVFTTFGALQCFIAIMTAYPEVQERLQKEADEVLGDREPRLSDKPNMPYTEATLLELLRYISHVPLLVPHKATKDSTLGGYFIPKGTQIWVNAFSLHHDERYWEKPWTFMPERFLDEEGHFVTAEHPNRRRMISFGSGTRICPGEVLARNRMFLFLASMTQNFNFVAAEGKDKPKHDPREYLPGLVLKAQEYKVFAEYRK